MLTLPSDHIAQSRTVTPETLRACYAHVEGLPGGYFPVGENTVWHGGVHLRTRGVLYAPLAGRLVAARLAEDEATAIGPYGSRNFLLIEHAVPAPSNGGEEGGEAERRFFTLLMHLRPRALRADAMALRRFAWLKQDKRQIGLRVRTEGLNYRSEPSAEGNEPLGQLAAGDLVVPRPEAPRAEALLEGRGDTAWQYVRVQKIGEGAFVYCSDEHVRPAYEAAVDEALLERFGTGKVVPLDIEVEAGTPLWEVGSYGSPGYRATLVHWEVFSEERLFVGAAHGEGRAEREGDASDTEADGSGDERLFARVVAPQGVDVYGPDYTARGGRGRRVPVGRLAEGTIVEITEGSGDGAGGAEAWGPCWVRTEEMNRDPGVRGEPVFIQAADRQARLAPSRGWQRRGAWVTGVHRLSRAHAHAGEQAVFEARLRLPAPTPAERARISWEIRLDDALHETLGQAGARLEVEITKAMRGKTLAAYPYLRAAEEDLVAEVEVTELPLLRWQAAQDADDNYNLDSAKVQQVVADFAAEGGDATLLEREEIRRFYRESQQRMALRSYACKFVSEWGIPDLEKAVDDLWGKGWLRKVFTDYEAKIQPHLWWEEAEAAGVEALPASPHVWHYNPIAVLQQLWHEGYGQTQPLVWGAKVSAAFRRKVVQICDELEVDPNYLMAVMAFESGETFRPDIKNPRSTATGLIQFMSFTAKAMGTTTNKLAKMTAVEQLDYVKQYFADRISVRGKLKTLEDTYMAVLLPSMIGKPNNHVMFEKGSDEYEDNAGLDTNYNGKVTKAEAASKVREKLERGKQFFQ